MNKLINNTNKLFFLNKHLTYYSYYTSKVKPKYFSLIRPNNNSSHGKYQLYYFQKNLFTKKRTNKQSEKNNEDTSSNSNEFIIDIESNSSNDQYYSNTNKNLHISRFVDNKLGIITQSKRTIYIYYFSILGYLLFALFLIRVIKKTYSNKEQAKWKKYLKYIFSLAIITYICLQLLYFQQVTKIRIQRLFLLSDGKRLQIDYFFPKSQIVKISDFRKIPKQELIHLPPEIITLAMEEESYLVSFEDNIGLIPAYSIILEKDILAQVASSQNINIIN